MVNPSSKTLRKGPKWDILLDFAPWRPLVANFDMEPLNIMGDWYESAKRGDSGPPMLWNYEFLQKLGLRIGMSTQPDLTCVPQVMEGSTGNSKNVPKKSTRLGRMMGIRQYNLRLWCEPKSLQPACTKFSNFVPILDTSTFTTPSFISSVVNSLLSQKFSAGALTFNDH